MRPPAGRVSRAGPVSRRVDPTAGLGCALSEGGSGEGRDLGRLLPLIVPDGTAPGSSSTGLPVRPMKTIPLKSSFKEPEISQPKDLGQILLSMMQRLNIAGLKIEDSEYSVFLQSGWNMIGVPYTEAVLLYNIQIKSMTTGETRPYIDAVKAGWIGNTIYNLNTGNYEFASFNDDPPAVLEPTAGYWIYVGEENGVDVIFSKP